MNNDLAGTAERQTPEALLTHKLICMDKVWGRSYAKLSHTATGLFEHEFNDMIMSYCCTNQFLRGSFIKIINSKRWEVMKKFTLQDYLFF